MTPEVSVVITTRNRPERLAKCLTALDGQTFGRGRFEVVVVDDGSDVPLDAALAPFRKTMALRSIRKQQGGAASGRNAGVAAATGDIILFTDDDCEAAPDWIEKLARGVHASGGRMVGGRTVNGLRDNPFSSAAQAIVDLVYRFYNADPGNARFFATNNMACPRASFEKIGGFDEAYRLNACEDRDLCERWRGAGLKMLYDRSAVVYHSHAMSLKKFIAVHFTYGRGAVRFHRKNAEQGGGKMRDHTGLHVRMTQWFLEPLQQLPPPQALGRMALYVVWQVANVAGYLYQHVVESTERERSGTP